MRVAPQFIVVLILLISEQEKDEEDVTEGKEKTQYQIRCPVCDGRLCDVVTDQELAFPLYPPSCALVIKCWKCRKKVNIVEVNLSSPIYHHSQNDDIAAECGVWE